MTHERTEPCKDCPLLEEEPPPMLIRQLSCAVAAALLAALGSAAGAATIRDLGTASPAVTVRVAVVLRYRDPATLERLVDAQADPESPVYHHFLTPTQFREAFAPTPADYERVATELRDGGFRITHAFTNRTVIDAVAPAPVAARFFGTAIHRVLADGRPTYAEVGRARIPTSIRGLVSTVAGLDAIDRARPQYVRAAHPKHQPNLASPDGSPLYGPDGGYGPYIFDNAYRLPALHGHTGSGRASGVATDGDFLDSDLSSFLAYFNLHRTGPATTRVPVDGGPGSGLNEDSIETTLDVETIVSTSPGTALYVYEAPLDEPTNANFIDIYNAVVNDDVVDTLNSSYTYCETAIDQEVPGYTQSVDAIEQQGNALGITFHAAAGDGGSNSPGCSGISVGEPASTPHSESIGGTTLGLTANGEESSEVGWSGSGGGVSVIFKVPTYQRRVPNVITSGRNLPDLAFDADPDSGASFFYDGSWSGPIGGTSLASPIFGGLLTQLDQVQNARSGNFNKTLYKRWLAHGYGNPPALYFRDIIQGSIPPYEAGPGYDQMSGIGAMLANDFAKLH
jgi:subtilase family serine protease